MMYSDHDVMTFLSIYFLSNAHDQHTLIDLDSIPCDRKLGFRQSNVVGQWIAYYLALVEVRAHIPFYKYLTAL